MTDALRQLRQASLNDCSEQIPPSVQQLADEICLPYEGHVVAVLFYGACLHQGVDEDSLIDFFIIVSNYRDIWPKHKLLRWANLCLPPNVFYHSAQIPGSGSLRCKYAILSIDAFVAGCTRWFHSYVFGRFAQPIALMHCRTEADKALILDALSTSTKRLLRETLPMMPRDWHKDRHAKALWRKALALSYGTELRPEPASRIDVLIAQAPDYYQNTADVYLQQVRLPPAQAGFFLNSINRLLVPFWRVRWLLRTILGKCLSLLRLLKALFTFDGAIDYAIYKMEKHTGKRLEISEKARKWPLLFLWGTLLKIWWNGIVR